MNTDKNNIIVDKIKKYFGQHEYLNNFLLYIDNTNTLKYIYNIPCKI